MSSPALISLLLPTRHRADELRRTLDGLERAAACPELLELLVYADHHDAPTLAVLYEFSCQAIVGRNDGYSELPRLINEMVELATGDWLFVFADDVGCETPAWDDVIRRYDHTVPALLTCENNQGNDFWFPVLSRPAYEAMGCVTRSQFHDIWLGEVFRRAGCLVHRRIPARFTDRIVCPMSMDRLSPDERSAFDRSVDEAAARLAAPGGTP
ncbi:MAG: glycosyltransferase family A protein [Thermoanaerobaculaceae bacterium]|jgi:hypothetical protein